jgi:hypothetical protein
MTKMWTIESLYSFINTELIDIKYDQFEFLLQDDDRFIVIENKIVTVNQ